MDTGKIFNYRKKDYAVFYGAFQYYIKLEKRIHLLSKPQIKGLGLRVIDPKKQVSYRRLIFKS